VPLDDLPSVPSFDSDDDWSFVPERKAIMKNSKWMLGGLFAMALFALSGRSYAQDAPAGGGAGAGGGGGGAGGDYGYKFEDDPLAAGGFGPSDATIRVRPGPVRTTLIRPRTSFVPEMLKSVENI
jgi:hypothetical protein